MEEYKQGETYQEDLPEEEKEQVTPSVLNSNKIKLLVALGVVIMFVVVLLFTASKKHNQPTDKPSDEATSDEQSWEEFVEEQEASTDTSDTSAQAPSYSTDTVTSLRKWGYTGDEISYALSNGIKPETMIQEAKNLRKEADAEVMKELSDTSSKPYKKLLGMTWLGGDPLHIEDLSANTDANYSLDTHVLNADYVKCEPRGNQLFIRLTLDDGTYAFMTVDPPRWVQLKEKGNMVIQYDLYTYGDAKVITNITEVVQGESNATN